MTEKLMTYDEDGQTLCLKDRSLVHHDGDLHYATQCWIVNNRNKVIMQLRHPKKERSPNKWDVSCGGHCVDGEDPLTGAIREAEEELGLALDASRMKKLSMFRYSSQEGRNQELIHIYLYKLDFDINTLRYQKEEISAIKALSVTELKKQYDEKAPSLANREGAYKSVFKYFKLM